VIVILLALLVSACGGSQTAEPVSTDIAEIAGPTAAEEVSPAEKVQIRMWTHQNDSFNAGYTALGEKYTLAHPNVEILFETFDYDTYIQTLQTALPAKTEADILQMFGSWVCSYAEGGNLAEMPTSLISLEEAKTSILGAPVGGYICQDKLYGIPQEYNIEYGAVLLNTKIAEEVGATNYMDGWADWEKVIEDGKKMAIVQDGVMTRAGLNFTGSDGIATMFHSLYLQYGGQYLKDGVYTVNTEEGVKTLELMKRLVDEGLVDPLLYNDEENWVGDSFFAETSAMGLVGPWAIPEYSGDYPEVAAATIYQLLPSVGSDPVFAAASGWGLSVSNNSKVQETAWDFVKFFPWKWTMPCIQPGLRHLQLKENISGQMLILMAEFPYFKPSWASWNLPVRGSIPRPGFRLIRSLPDVLNFLQGNASVEDPGIHGKRSQGSFK
jgi:multiple sugar transport system substrate-binding protein